MTVMGKRDPETFVGNANGRCCCWPWGLPVGASVLQKCHPSLAGLDYLLPCLYLGTAYTSYMVHPWAGSSSSCSSKLLLSLLQFWCFTRQFLLHLSILPSGALIMYGHKILSASQLVVPFASCFTLYTSRIICHILNSGSSAFFDIFSLSVFIMQLLSLSAYFYLTFIC